MEGQPKETSLKIWYFMGGKKIMTSCSMSKITNTVTFESSTIGLKFKSLITYIIYNSDHFVLSTVSMSNVWESLEAG